MRFAEQQADGTPLRDDSVVVNVTDADGRALIAPLMLDTTPVRGVVFQDGVYHADLSTKGLAPGTYVLRARFGSSRLRGELSLGITLQ